MSNLYKIGRKLKIVAFLLILLVLISTPVLLSGDFDFGVQNDDKLNGKQEKPKKLEKQEYDHLVQLDPDEIEQVVDPYRTYSYNDMENDLQKLSNIYGDLLEIKTIGESVMGKNIYAVRLGNGQEDSNIMIEASHHAREWIASNLTMKKLDRYAQAYVRDEKIGEYRVRDVLAEVGIWFIPMVNPDGVMLHQEGLDGIPEKYHDEFIDYNIDWAGTDFYLWKANINGVDLNRQYPADWAESDCTGARFAMNFKGEDPLSEPEAKAVYEFTNQIDPLITLSYHSRGQVIFWFYHNEYLERDQKIGNNLSELTGYDLYPPRPDYKGANFNDWFIQEYDRPGYIIELVPFTGEEQIEELDYLEEEWKNNKQVGVFLSDIAEKKLK